MLSSSFLSQGPKASSWRVQSALCMWFTHRRGRSSPWAVGCAEMPTPSNQQKTLIWKPVCLLWFLAAAEAQPWSLALALSGLLDWIRFPPYAESPQVCSSTNISNMGLWYHPLDSELPEWNKGTIDFKKEEKKRKYLVTCLHAAVVFPRLL